MALSRITSPDSSILPNAVAALSVLATSVGLVSIIDPMEAIPQFGLSYPAQHNYQTMSLSVALTRVYGVRNMSMGLINLAIWWNGRKSGDVAWRHALGWAMIMNLGTPIVDGMMCEAQGKTSGWKHWVFVPVAAALGAGLLLQL